MEIATGRNGIDIYFENLARAEQTAIERAQIDTLIAVRHDVERLEKHSPLTKGTNKIMTGTNDQALDDARALIDSYISTGAISDLMGARPLLNDMIDAIDAHLEAAPTAIVESAANEVVEPK